MCCLVVIRVKLESPEHLSYTNSVRKTEMAPSCEVNYSITKMCLKNIVVRKDFLA